MLEVFTTRELAMFIWFLIFCIASFLNNKIRKSIINVIKCLLSIKLVVPFFMLFLYTCILTLILQLFCIEITKFIKDILLWFIFAGIPFSYSSISKDIDSVYFKKYIFDNIKVIAVLEFMVSTFTFKLWIELIIIPIIIIISVLDAVTEMKEEYKSVHKFLSYILSLIGIYIILSSLCVAIDTYYNYTIVDLVISFFIPFIFSIFFIPVTYIFVLYARYETLFCRMSFRENKDTKIKNRIYIIKNFKFSLKKIKYFTEKCLYKTYINMQEEEFKKLVCETNANYKLK